MEGKEKMMKIYEAVLGMTLDVLNMPKQNKKKNLIVLPDEYSLEMVRTTPFLYETINHANQLIVTAASMIDVSYD